MNSKFCGIVLGCLLSVPVEATACQDKVIQLVEADFQKRQGRRAEMFIACHGGSYSIPEVVSLHLIWEKEHLLCHQILKSCGNINTWKVSVEPRLTFDIVTFDDVIDVFNREVDIEIDSPLTVEVNWGHIISHCQAHQEQPICI